MVNKHRNYLSPSILWFLKKTGKVDPEEAVKAEATRLLYAAGLTTPPFEPRRVAHIQKVASINRSDISIVSQLTPIKGGFNITLKSLNAHDAASISRNTFSIAHEIGHTLFYDVESAIPSRPHGDLGSEAEERLCNIFAAELLMPQYQFKSDAGAIFKKTSNWCESLFRLRSLYRVSMRAAVERVVELEIVRGAVFVKWRWKPKVSSGSDVKLRVDWSIPLKEGRYYFVWPDKPAPNDSTFLRASAEDCLIREVARLKLGALNGEFIVEARSYDSSDKELSGASTHLPRSVLSVIWPKLE